MHVPPDLASRLDLARSDLALAAVDLETLDAKLASARANVERLETAYGDSPTDTNAAALLAGRTSLDLATIARAGAARRNDAARASVTAAEIDVALAGLRPQLVAARVHHETARAKVRAARDGQALDVAAGELAATRKRVDELRRGVAALDTEAASTEAGEQIAALRVDLDALAAALDGLADRATHARARAEASDPLHALDAWLVDIGLEHARDLTAAQAAEQTEAAARAHLDALAEQLAAADPQGAAELDAAHLARQNAARSRAAQRTSAAGFRAALASPLAVLVASRRLAGAAIEHVETIVDEHRALAAAHDIAPAHSNPAAAAHLLRQAALTAAGARGMVDPEKVAKWVSTDRDAAALAVWGADALGYGDATHVSAEERIALALAGRSAEIALLDAARKGDTALAGHAQNVARPGILPRSRARYAARELTYSRGCGRWNGAEPTRTAELRAIIAEALAPEVAALAEDPSVTRLDPRSEAIPAARTPRERLALLIGAELVDVPEVVSAPPAIELQDTRRASGARPDPHSALA